MQPHMLVSPLGFARPIHHFFPFNTKTLKDPGQSVLPAFCIGVKYKSNGGAR
jgi:hypothetical protein